jgi:hypothetical protein
VRYGVGLVVLVLLAGCGGDDERRTVTVQMEEQMGSTQFGQAVLMELEGSRTRIEVSVGLGGADQRQPVRIYRGSCDRLDDEPVYALEDNVEGDSVTELEVPLDEFLDRPHAITVHETPQRLRLLAACGEIPPARRR